MDNIDAMVMHSPKTFMCSFHQGFTDEKQNKTTKFIKS